LAQQIGEHARYFCWFRRRMIEWGINADVETLALVAQTDELLTELKMHLNCHSDDRAGDRRG